MCRLRVWQTVALLGFFQGSRSLTTRGCDSDAPFHLSVAFSEYLNPCFRTRAAADSSRFATELDELHPGSVVSVATFGDLMDTRHPCFELEAADVPPSHLMPYLSQACRAESSTPPESIYLKEYGSLDNIVNSLPTAFWNSSVQADASLSALYYMSNAAAPPNVTRLSIIVTSKLPHYREDPTNDLRWPAADPSYAPTMTKPNPDCKSSNYPALAAVQTRLKDTKTLPLVLYTYDDPFGEHLNAGFGWSALLGHLGFDGRIFSRPIHPTAENLYSRMADMIEHMCEQTGGETPFLGELLDDTDAGEEAKATVSPMVIVMAAGSGLAVAALGGLKLWKSFQASQEVTTSESEPDREGPPEDF